MSPKLKRLLRPSALCGLYTLAIMTGGCNAPEYTTNLREVMQQEIGRSAEDVPAYRCTTGAHRGASVAYLENTLLALKAAENDPRYAFVEFDVQYSKDGEIVVFHDQRLFRLFRSLNSIKNSTYAELLEKTDGEIARYRDAMDLLHKKINIEIKSNGDEEADRRLADELIADIRMRGREDDIMISSISGDVIRYIKLAYPSTPTGQIYWLTSSTYVHLDILTERLYEDLSDSKADYLMLHVANFRNIRDLLKLKPPGKTVMFWDFDDQMYLVHQCPSDRLWGTPTLRDRWQDLFGRQAAAHAPDAAAPEEPPARRYRPERLSTQRI